MPDDSPSSLSSALSRASMRLCAFMQSTVGKDDPFAGDVIFLTSRWRAHPTDVGGRDFQSLGYFCCPERSAQRTNSPNHNFPIDMKLSHIASAIAMAALGFASVGASATIVNIDAMSPSGSTITLDAGTYTASWIGIADGGAYNAWEASNGSGWRDAYTVTNMTDGGVVTFDLGVDNHFYVNATALGALSAFQSAGAGGLALLGAAPGYSFLGNASSPVSFTIGHTTTFDYTVPDYKFDDNAGGVSLNITAAVPEPETYAMMLAGLGALGLLARRRRPNSI